MNKTREYLRYLFSMRKQISGLLSALKLSYSVLDDKLAEDIFGRKYPYGINYNCIRPMIRAGYSLEEIKRRIIEVINYPLFVFHGTYGYMYGKTLRVTFNMDRMERAALSCFVEYGELTAIEKLRFRKLSDVEKWLLITTSMPLFRRAYDGLEIDWCLAKKVIEQGFEGPYAQIYTVPDRVLWKSIGITPDKRVINVVPKELITRFTMSSYKLFHGLVDEFNLSDERDISGAAMASLIYKRETILEMLSSGVTFQDMVRMFSDTLFNIHEVDL